MEVSTRPDGTIQQYGTNLGPLDGCTIRTIDDDQAAQLQRVGTKTLHADGTITVTPLDTSADDSARDQARVQHARDRATVIDSLPTQEAQDAMARLLDSMLGPTGGNP